jgi:hypothetical protein
MWRRGSRANAARRLSSSTDVTKSQRGDTFANLTAGLLAINIIAAMTDQLPKRPARACDRSTQPPFQGVAQLVARRIRDAKVAGSIPAALTNNRNP